MSAHDTDTTAAGKNVAPSVNLDIELIDVSQLLRQIVRQWWFLLAFAAIGAYQGYQNLRGFSPTYEARMIVAPSSEGADGGQALSGIASTIGLQVQSAGKSSTFERLKVLTGALSFAQRLQDKYGLLQTIYAAEWDEATQGWIKPSGEEFERSERIRRFLRQPTWRPPSLERLASYLGGVLQFETYGSSGSSFIVVSTRHAERDKALELLKLVYFEADDMLREQDRQETDIRRRYLWQKLDAVNLSALRGVLLSLMQQEEQKAMMLDGELPYAAKIIEPAFVSEYPAEPNLIKLIIMPIAGWLAAAFVLVLLYALLRREGQPIIR